MIKKIKIFLASSKELQMDRERFELEVYRKSKIWIDKGIFLHLDIWEDLPSQMSDTRTQDVYNQFVEGSDLFILLAHTKVGIYSAEEFEKAFGAFKSTQKPFIFTYFKETTLAEEPSLKEFKSRLQALGHFYNTFRNTDDLWSQFNKELDRLLLNGFDRNDWKNENKNKTTTVHSQGATIKNQFIGGNFDNPTFN
ncbi:hypothetical protein [Cyclobacterium amurskyense]|uniref:hypothetical protein n=1 Tax=Cyclobacterium amurskyense TaxID=320787 RepID=UPI0030DC516E|tara:strand:+ start:1399 stop:1983 length:585 start_codon:yes stop_codon:yes gene_type:complete